MREETILFGTWASAANKCQLTGISMPIAISKLFSMGIENVFDIRFLETEGYDENLDEYTAEATIELFRDIADDLEQELSND